MDYVFLDTCVYHKKQYFKKGNLIHTLRDLATKNIIQLVTTRITINEIKANLIFEIKDGLEKVKKSDSMLSHLDDWQLPLEINIEEKVNQIVDEYFDCESIHIIEYEECRDIDKVFSLYFNSQPPFGGNNKKSEFPDAFVLMGLENFSKYNDDSLDKDDYRYVVLSYDKDITTFKSDRLYIPVADEYIDAILEDGNNKEKYLDVIKRNVAEVQKGLEKQITSDMFNSGLYYPISRYVILTHIEIESCKAEISFDNPLIFNNTDEFIEFELSATIHVVGEIAYKYENLSQKCTKLSLVLNFDINPWIRINKRQLIVDNIHDDPPALFEIVNKYLFAQIVNGRTKLS